MTGDKSKIIDDILMHLKGISGDGEDLKNLTASSDLIGSGLLDSLTIVRLIQFVEEQFNLQIADEDIEPELFASVDYLAEYVRMHQK